MVQQAINSVPSDVKENDGEDIEFAHSAVTFMCSDRGEWPLKMTECQTELKQSSYAHLAKKRRTKAAGSKHGDAPSSIKMASQTEQREDWQKSIGNEIDGLIDIGVITHDWSLERLSKRDITSNPVQLGLYFDYKFDEKYDICG